MPGSDLANAFERALSGRHLLTHPYYQRWQDGELTFDDLGDYAEQYRHIERCLPGVLATTVEQLAEGDARRLVESNLADEQTAPRPHAEIFEGFASSVGAGPLAEPSDATRRLVALYEDAASAGPVCALAVVGAYELQAADVAETKGDALRAHYGLGTMATEFWDVHADLERSHADWTLGALSDLHATEQLVLEFATASANVWWEFLDERDGSRIN